MNIFLQTTDTPFVGVEIVEAGTDILGKAEGNVIIRKKDNTRRQL